MTTAVRPISSLAAALPFWLSLGFVPLIWIGAWGGGFWLLLAPLYAFGLISLMDAIGGLNLANPDTGTPVEQLFWYRLFSIG